MASPTATDRTTRWPRDARRYDFNRDGRIDAADVLIVRNNQRHTLPLFTAPAAAAASAPVVVGDFTVPAPRPAARPLRRGVLDAAEPGLLA